MEHGPAEQVRQHLLADRPLPGRDGPVHREPRRAQGVGGVPRRQGTRGGGGHPHAARLPAAARGAVRGTEGAGCRSSSAGARPSRSTATSLAFYARLLRGDRRPTSSGTATGGCASASGWPDNQTCQNILAWCWAKGDDRALVVVNFGTHPAQARVRVPWDELRGRQWRLDDMLSRRDLHAQAATRCATTGCTWTWRRGSVTCSR